MNIEKHIIFITILFFFIFQSSVLLSQEIEVSKPVKKIVNKIKRHNIYEFAVCQKRTNSKQIKNYNKLKEIATKDELVILTNHKNSVVIAYAVKGLIAVEYDSLYQVILEHLDDFRKLNVFVYGCDYVNGGSYKTTIIDFIISAVKDELNKQEKSDIDSILIYSDIEYNYVKYLLYNEKLPEKYHKRIKEFVISNKYESAPIALASYRDTNDIEILLNELSKSTNSLIYYPIIKTILYFKDDKLNKEMIEILKQKDKIDVLGLEKVGKILKENNLKIE